MATRKDLNFWTQEQDNIVIDNFGKMPAYEIGKLIGRTDKAISARVKILRKVHNLKLQGYKFENWTGEEINFLRKNYSVLQADDIAKHLGKTVNAIRGKADRLNIRVGVRISTILKKQELKQTDKGYVRKATGSGGIHLLDLRESTCRFPFDDKTFCGCAVAGGVYCAEHMALCYQPQKNRVKLGRW